jgi:hypothetical protein
VTGTVARTTVSCTSDCLSTFGGTLNASSVVLKPSGAGGRGASAYDQPAVTGTMNLDGATIVGDGNAGSIGIGAFPFSNSTAVVNATNTIIRNVGKPRVRLGSASNTANTVLTYSDFDPTVAPASDMGPGSHSPAPGQLGATNVNVDPLFAGAGDFHLTQSSPVIDLGDPATAAGVDFDGLDRLVDGNGDCTARRDMGAFEGQTGQCTPQPPTQPPTTPTPDPLALTLAAGKHPSFGRKVRVGATCSTECDLVGSGKVTIESDAKTERYRLKKVNTSGAPGQRVNLKLRLSDHAFEQAKDALDGAKALATVKVRASNALGEQATQKLKLPLKH